MSPKAQSSRTGTADPSLGIERTQRNFDEILPARGKRQKIKLSKHGKEHSFF